MTQISGTSPAGNSDEGRPLAYGHYAKLWWEDACGEVPAADAGAAAVRHAVRRQVIFVVSALESWFFEWVRDEVLGEVRRSAVLFSELDREGITDRIKTVTKKLHAEDELPDVPDFGDLKVWQPLCELVDDRNGLVHALASLPRGSIPPGAKVARPKPRSLRELAPDRPLRIVRRAVTLITGFADSEPPDWMEVP